MPDNPDTRPLPDGWVEQYDERRQRWFYKQTSVTPPRISYAHPRGALKPSVTTQRTPPILDVRGHSQAPPPPSPSPSSPAAALYRHVPASPLRVGAASPATNLPPHMRRVFSVPGGAPASAPGYPLHHPLPPLPPRTPRHRRFTTSTSDTARPLSVQHYVRRPPRMQSATLPYLAPPPEITSFDPVPQVRLRSTDLYHAGPASLGAGYLPERFALPLPRTPARVQPAQAHQATQHPIPGYQPTGYGPPAHQPSPHQPSTSYQPHQSTSSLGPPESTTPPVPYQLEAPAGSTAYAPPTAPVPDPAHIDVGVQACPQLDAAQASGSGSADDADDDAESLSSLSTEYGLADSGVDLRGEGLGPDFDFGGAEAIQERLALELHVERGSTPFGMFSAALMQGEEGFADGAPPYDPGF